MSQSAFFDQLPLAAIALALLAPGCGLDAAGDSSGGACATCAPLDASRDTSTVHIGHDATMSSPDTGPHHDATASKDAAFDGHTTPLDSHAVDSPMTDASSDVQDALPDTGMDAGADVGIDGNTGCDDGNPCSSGCCIDNVCQQTSCPAGSSCTAGPQCCTGSCTGGVCVVSPSGGGACCADSDCESRNCMTAMNGKMMCGPPSCGMGAQCPAGNFCDNGGMGNMECCSGTCMANKCGLGGAGDTCCSNTDCCTGVCGGLGKCTKSLPTEACCTNPDCTVGSCDQGTCGT